MKKLFALALALLMAFGAIACSGGSKDTTAATAADAGKSLTVFDDSEYAGMTVDELYEAALKEGGKLVIYSETSSTEKSMAGFLEQYPGIEVEVSKYKNYDISAKIPLEYDSDQPYCDLVIAGDSSGAKYNEWYPNGYAVAYIPAEMKDDLYADYIGYGLPITIEGDVWWYSKNMYPDGCPVKSWWDVVEKDENGNSKYHVYMHDASNETVAGMICNLVYHSDELAAAYKEEYGKDLEYTYNAEELGVEANNAGFEWLYRYLQGNYTVMTDSDEILATIDASKEPSLGFGTTLKYGDTIEAGENVFFCLGMKPWIGFAKVKYVYICSKTDNPAAARLFAIYALGGADGSGKGYNAFVKRNGCYGTRNSHDDSTHSDVSFEELNIVPSNIGVVYDSILDIQDFWTYYADKLK